MIEGAISHEVLKEVAAKAMDTKAAAQKLEQTQEKLQKAGIDLQNSTDKRLDSPAFSQQAKTHPEQPGSLQRCGERLKKYDDLFQGENAAPRQADVKEQPAFPQKAMEKAGDAPGREVSLTESPKALAYDRETMQSTPLETLERSNLEQKSNLEYALPENRSLTEAEKQQYKSEYGLKDNLLDALRTDKDGTLSVQCINEKYVDSVNPETKVPYKKEIISINGCEMEVVVPEFKPVFEVQIPERLYEAGDYDVFKYCTQQLKDSLEKNPQMQENFTAEALERIEKGLPRVPGWTWHHTATPGKLQLVDSNVHFDTKHTGGDFLWCGGIR